MLSSYRTQASCQVLEVTPGSSHQNPPSRYTQMLLDFRYAKPSRLDLFGRQQERYSLG